MSRCPCAAAKWRAVSSPIFRALIRAPRRINISTMLDRPSLAAQCKGLNPWSSLWKTKYYAVKEINSAILYFNQKSLFSHDTLLQQGPYKYLSKKTLHNDIDGKFNYSHTASYKSLYNNWNFLKEVLIITQVNLHLYCDKPTSTHGIVTRTV